MLAGLLLGDLDGDGAFQARRRLSRFTHPTLADQFNDLLRNYAFGCMGEPP